MNTTTTIAVLRRLGPGLLSFASETWLHNVPAWRHRRSAGHAATARRQERQPQPLDEPTAPARRATATTRWRPGQHRPARAWDSGDPMPGGKQGAGIQRPNFRPARWDSATQCGSRRAGIQRPNLGQPGGDSSDPGTGSRRMRANPRPHLAA